MPLEGSLLVNGEVQKRSEEILAEVAIALTLSRLRDQTGQASLLCALSELPISLQRHELPAMLSLSAHLQVQ